MRPVGDSVLEVLASAGSLSGAHPLVLAGVRVGGHQPEVVIRSFGNCACWCQLVLKVDHFLKVAQAVGRTWDLLDFHLFSISIAAP